MSYSSYRSRRGWDLIGPDPPPAVDPQYVPRVSRHPQWGSCRNVGDLEHPAELCPLNLSGGKYPPTLSRSTAGLVGEQPASTTTSAAAVSAAPVQRREADGDVVVMSSRKMPIPDGGKVTLDGCTDRASHISGFPS